MTNQLKPCPNPECGETELYVNTADVWCVKCGMYGPHTSNPQEAIRLWNLLPRVYIPEIKIESHDAVPEGMAVAVDDKKNILGAIVGMKPKTQDLYVNVYANTALHTSHLTKECADLYAKQNKRTSCIKITGEVVG